MLGVKLLMISSWPLGSLARTELEGSDNREQEHPRVRSSRYRLRSRGAQRRLVFRSPKAYACFKVATYEIKSTSLSPHTVHIANRKQALLDRGRGPTAADWRKKVDQFPRPTHARSVPHSPPLTQRVPATKTPTRLTACATQLPARA